MLLAICDITWLPLFCRGGDGEGRREFLLPPVTPPPPLQNRGSLLLFLGESAPEYPPSDPSLGLRMSVKQQEGHYFTICPEVRAQS